MGGTGPPRSKLQEASSIIHQLMPIHHRIGSTGSGSGSSASLHLALPPRRARDGNFHHSRNASPNCCCVSHVSSLHYCLRRSLRRPSELFSAASTLPHATAVPATDIALQVGAYCSDCARPPTAPHCDHVAQRFADDIQRYLQQCKASCPCLGVLIHHHAHANSTRLGPGIRIQRRGQPRDAPP